MRIQVRDHDLRRSRSLSREPMVQGKGFSTYNSNDSSRILVEIFDLYSNDSSRILVETMIDNDNNSHNNSFFGNPD